jgi:hypothetical protein
MASPRLRAVPIVKIIPLVRCVLTLKTGVIQFWVGLWQLPEQSKLCRVTNLSVILMVACECRMRRPQQAAWSLKHSCRVRLPRAQLC